MPHCSIIIPVYNLAPVTRRCLDHLLALPRGEHDWEIVVVDDGSRDATQQVLAAYGDQIRVVTHRRNLGFAPACNDGAAIALGRYLVFLNNDTVPIQGWLDALVHHADAHPQTAVVGAKLLYPNGTIQHAGIVIDHDLHPRHIYVGFPCEHPAVNKSRRFQIVTGGCFLITREAFATAKGFDTAFLNGFEDVDLCLRLGAMGYDVRYCHESVIFHLESISEGRRRHQDQNLARYNALWADRVTPDDWRYYLEDGLIEIEYPDHGPLRFHIDPGLGVLDVGKRESSVDRLLTLRAEQVRELLRENIHLTVKGLARAPDASSAVSRAG